MSAAPEEPRHSTPYFARALAIGFVLLAIAAAVGAATGERRAPPAPPAAAR